MLREPNSFRFSWGGSGSFDPLPAFRGERTLAFLCPYKRHNRYNSNPFSIFHSFPSTCILSGNYNRKSSPELAVLLAEIKLGKKPFLPGSFKMPAVTQSEISLLHLARVVWRHKGKMLACFVAAVGLATVAALFLAENISLRRKTARSVGARKHGDRPHGHHRRHSDANRSAVAQNEINSIIEIVHSRVLIEKVVDAIGPEVLMESSTSPTLLTDDGSSSASAMVRAAAIRMLTKSLNVEAAQSRMLC